MPAKYLQNAFNMPAEYLQNACRIPAEYLQNACEMPSEYLQNSCRIPAKCLQNTCRTWKTNAVLLFMLGGHLKNTWAIFAVLLFCSCYFAGMLKVFADLLQVFCRYLEGILKVGVRLFWKRERTAIRTSRRRLKPEPQLLSASGWTYEVGTPKKACVRGKHANRWVAAGKW